MFEFIKRLFRRNKPEHGFECLGGGNISKDSDMIGMYTDYYVYNQNGFNNALYYSQGLDDFNDPMQGIYKWGSEKKEIRKMAKDCYPTKYPCIMRIYTYHTFESGILCAEFIY